MSTIDTIIEQLENADREVDRVEVDLLIEVQRKLENLSAAFLQLAIIVRDVESRCSPNPAAIPELRNGRVTR